MDLWQFYGYLEAGKQLERERILRNSYSRKQIELSLVLAQGKNITGSVDNFFQFEKEIETLFDDSDPLEDDGQFEIDLATGEEIWVYNYAGIQKLSNTLRKMGGVRA